MENLGFARGRFQDSAILNAMKPQRCGAVPSKPINEKLYSMSRPNARNLLFSNINIDKILYSTVPFLVQGRDGRGNENDVHMLNCRNFTAAFIS